MILFFKCDRLCVNDLSTLRYELVREKQSVCMEGFIVLSQHKKSLLRKITYVTTSLRQSYPSGRDRTHTHTHTHHHHLLLMHTTFSSTGERFTTKTSGQSQKLYRMVLSLEIGNVEYSIMCLRGRRSFFVYYYTHTHTHSRRVVRKRILHAADTSNSHLCLSHWAVEGMEYDVCVCVGRECVSVCRWRCCGTGQ